MHSSYVNSPASPSEHGRSAELQASPASASPDSPASQACAEAPSHFGRSSAQHADPLVSMRGVTFRRGERTLFENVDFDLHPGEFVAVLGPNGAGKSTFLNLLLGQLHPEEGSITVDGASPGRLSGRGGHVGFVPQQRAFDPGLTLRGRDLVRLGADGHRFGPGMPRWLPSKTRAITDSIVADSIALMRVEHLADKQIGKMSGGEQQRMRIAQALATDPHVLLCDEPLLSLDLHGQRTVAEVLEHMRTEHGTGVVFVTHEINPVLPLVDRVIYLVDGRHRIGTPDEIFTSETLSELFNTRVEVLRVRGQVVVVGDSGRLGASIATPDDAGGED